jgi:hypothetical protein
MQSEGITPLFLWAQMYVGESSNLVTLGDPNHGFQTVVVSIFDRLIKAVRFLILGFVPFADSVPQGIVCRQATPLVLLVRPENLTKKSVVSDKRIGPRVEFLISLWTLR